MIARAPPAKSTTAVSAINKGVLIAASLLRSSRTKHPERWFKMNSRKRCRFLIAPDLSFQNVDFFALLAEQPSRGRTSLAPGA